MTSRSTQFGSFTSRSGQWNKGRLLSRAGQQEETSFMWSKCYLLSNVPGYCKSKENEQAGAELCQAQQLMARLVVGAALSIYNLRKKEINIKCQTLGKNCLTGLIGTVDKIELKTIFGSIYVVKQHLFSIVPSILTFCFYSILGRFSTFWGPNGLFLGSESG